MQLEMTLGTTLQTNQPRHHEEETQNTNSHTTARTQSKHGNCFSYLSEMQLERTLITELQTNPPRHHEEETQNTNSHTTARTQSKHGNCFSYLSEMQLERTLSTALRNKDQSHRNTKYERNNKQSIDTNRATALEHTAAKAVDMGDSNTVQVLMTDTSIPFITHSPVTCIRYYGSISTITQWIDNWNDWNDIRSLGYGGT